MMMLRNTLRCVDIIVFPPVLTAAHASTFRASVTSSHRIAMRAIATATSTQQQIQAATLRPPAGAAGWNRHATIGLGAAAVALAGVGLVSTAAASQGETTPTPTTPMHAADLTALSAPLMEADNVNSATPTKASAISTTVPATKGGLPSSVVTDHPQYIKGIKIYGIGILEDPVPGEKRGRGKQHLTSSYWIYDVGIFISRHMKELQTMATYAYEKSLTNPGYDYRYFTNVSNALFLKAEAEGLKTADGRDFFLMAGWLAMAAAEVDGFTYAKYTPQKRAQQREEFYAKYMNPDVMWDPDEEDEPELEQLLGKYAIDSSRLDMIPSVALERLGIHNELCSLKWADANAWMREGFVVSARIDSMKRHYESIHARDASEDHMAHLIWGFMAITHVIAVFPQANDLENYEQARRANFAAADCETRALVGEDGGFRPKRHAEDTDGSAACAE